VAGIAQQANGPMAALLGDLRLAQGEIRDIRDHLERHHGPMDRLGHALRLGLVLEGMTDAEKAAHRIESIVRDLKLYASPRTERAPVRLSEVVKKALRWIPGSVHQVATLKVEDAGAPPVLASFGQIEQVVVNLVTNAAAASRPGHPNLIIVRTGPGSPGMGRLEVVDQGVGMEPARLERIFEPVLASAETGPGLGLAACQSIVLAHDGTLTATSQPGLGSTFRMELPAAPVPAAAPSR
jgi:signal transduction histidine kinase